MKLKMLIITFLSSLTISLNAQDIVFENIKNKTWYEDNGFAGISTVFIKCENGQIKAIQQLHGSGVPVILSVLCDVEIRKDTVYLLNSLTRQSGEKLKNIYYTYIEGHGLKQLRILYEEPIIYVSLKEREIIDTPLNVNKLTKICCEKNEVYINEEVYKLYQ